jgi:c-di-GMP-binding flagellar brake protein YcgR
LLKKSRRQKALSSVIENISAGGLSLAIKEDLRVGELLELQIQVPPLEEAVYAVAEVVWFSLEQDKREEKRKAGVRFRDVESNDLKHLLEYILGIGIG